MKKGKEEDEGKYSAKQINVAMQWKREKIGFAANYLVSIHREKRLKEEHFLSVLIQN